MAEAIARTLISGSEVALIAVGMTIVFGVSRFANVAQVEFATLGAYGTLLASSVIGGGIILNSVISIIVVGALSVVLYHLLFVRLLKRNAATAMIGSLALSIAIRAVIQTITGPDPKSLKLPLERGKDIAGALVTPREIWIVVIGAAMLTALLLVLRFTPLGRSIRAVSTNRDLAQATGIDVRRSPTSSGSSAAPSAPSPACCWRSTARSAWKWASPSCCRSSPRRCSAASGRSPARSPPPTSWSSSRTSRSRSTSASSSARPAPT
jgi:branched-subunit amino acid ABC-type transport system permease component